MNAPTPDADASLVRLSIIDQLATITLDSPHNRNALSRRLVGELLECLAVAADPPTRVVVLTHTGNTFCAGADMTEMLDDGAERGTRDLLSLLRAIVDLPCPVIAVVRGHVRAGGIGLVGACDLAVVSESSTFAFSEALLGLTPAIISLTTKTRLTERDASRKYLSGMTFDGNEAARSGLVTQAVPAEAVDATLVSTVTELRKASPQGLRETKRLLNAELRARIDERGEDLVALSARLFSSDEAREGMGAFRERRLPSWVHNP